MGSAAGRTIRVSRQTCDAPQLLADGKEPDDRIIAITDERRQILTATAEAAGAEEEALAALATPCARVACTSARRPAATIRDTLGHASLSTTDLYLSSAPTDGSSLYLKF